MTLVAFAFLGLALAGCGGGSDKPEEDAADAMEMAEVALLCGETECGDTELCCNFQCVDATTDSENCGACGNACAEGQSCQEGLCTCGDAVCGLTESCCLEPVTACRTLQTDVTNCGACGQECSANEVCFQGQCACSTADGTFEACGANETCCPGIGCRSLEFDPGHCGACGSSCGAGELCVQGQCACGDVMGGGGNACGPSEACCGSPAECRPADDPECSCGTAQCGSGQSCCDVEGADTCVSTWREADNCGGCGNLCGPAQSCAGGDCLCSGGVADCNDDPADGCETRLDLDAQNCGECSTTCAPGEVCDGQGECALRCQLGLTDCDGQCVDLNWNRDNCGTCGNQCEPGEVANGAGECALTCLVGLTDCSGECVQLQSNRAHCGTCGVVCAPGEVCDGAGQCALTCVAGLTDCAGNCVDLQSNRAHCGTCGVSCAGGEVCQSGQCVGSCAVGTENCDGTCAILASNRFHCGACGNACGTGEQCVGGSCQLVCPPGDSITTCGDGSPGNPRVCADLSSSRNHCGACDNACENWERCDDLGNGPECVSNCLDGFEVCGGSCVDTSSNAVHCGTCDRACAGGEVCVDGGCCDAAGCGAPRDLSVSDDFACAVSSSGAVSCWGQNYSGELGTGDEEPRAAPALTSIDGIALEALSVSTGRYHACAVLTSGSVYCWGDNSSGQLGVGDTTDRSTPVEVDFAWGSPGFGAVEVSAGANHTCARLAAGEVYCWGSNQQRQLGDGSRINRSRPVPVQGLSDPIIQIDVGGNISCALTQLTNNETRVHCWGQTPTCTSASCGYLTAGESGPVIESTTMNALAGIQRIEVGGRACGVKADGSGWCWYTDHIAELVPVSAANSVEGYASLEFNGHYCGLTSFGQVACWGTTATYGRLGHSCTLNWDGCTLDVTEPTLVVDENGNAISATEVDSSFWHGCAIRLNGSISCWGKNNMGQVGDGSSSLGLPAEVQLPGVATQVDANGYVSCAVLPGTGVLCWGDGGEYVRGVVPELIPNTSDAVEVALLPYGTACFRDSNGAVFCWGQSYGYLLGDGCDPQIASGMPGACDPSASPVPVVGIDGTSASAVDLAAGEEHVCVALSDGTVRCWGANWAGQLGSGVMSDSSTPVEIVGLTNVEQVASGWYHTCARSSSGAVYCWGYNGLGMLGDGTSNNNPTPVVPGMFNGTDLVASSISTCYQASIAIQDNNSLWGWGFNGNAEIGPFGPDIEILTPRLFANYDPMLVPVDSDCAYHHCFAASDGTVWCHGSSNLTGPPDVDFSETALQVSGFGGAGRNATQVSVGDLHSCALLDTGSVECWGDNESAQLGDGSIYAPWAVSFQLP